MILAALRFAKLALQRLRSRLGLSLLSLLSTVLVIGIIVAIPVFSQGVSYLVLRDELAALGQHYPPLALRFYTLTSQPLNLVQVHDIKDQFVGLAKNVASLGVKQTVTRLRSPNLVLRPASDAPGPWSEENLVLNPEAHLLVLSGVAEEIVILAGRPFAETETKAETETEASLPAWVHEEMADQMGLQVGEVYDLAMSGAEEKTEKIRLEIAGIWREADRNSDYWRGTRVIKQADFLVTETGYEQVAQPALTQLGSRVVSWYMLPDAQELTLTKADTAAEGLALVPNIADTLWPNTQLDVSPLEPLTRYLRRKSILSAVLLGFSLPALSLLFYFLWLLATVTAQFQREEIAILVSRGTGRAFLMGLAGLEALILLSLSLPLGLGFGYLLAKGLGSTAGFLVFRPRPDFQVTLLGIDWRLVGAALVLLLGARLIPIVRATNKSIVAHLQERSRPLARSGLVKLTVDAALLVLSLYAYQQLNERGSLGIIGWEPEGNPFRDPLLLLTPSLFVFTISLILAHIFPPLMRLLDGVSRWLPIFSLYMGLRQLRRQSGQYTSSLFLIMVCLSLGAFYASMAASLDRWLHDRIYYAVGTDYRFAQGESLPVRDPFGNFVLPNTAITSKGERTGPWQLPVSDYLTIPGVVNAMRAGEYQAQPRLPNQSLPWGRFLGIERLTFPDIAFYRPDFSAVSLGELMNRLGMYPNGLLVSRQFFQRHNLLEGQALSLRVDVEEVTQGVDFRIVGVYDYFPTVFPADQEVFIGNLDYLFDQIGQVTLHHIWLKTGPEAEPAEFEDVEDVEIKGAMIETALKEMGVWPALPKEAAQLIRQDEARAERIGLFGILSVGFLSGAILAGLGLLVYTYASLQSRLQQVSILRAVGIQTREVLLMVSLEYVGVIIYGIAGGTIIGLLTSQLFVRFFRFSTEAALALPPFLPQIAWREIGWLALLFAVMLIISQGVILYRITRRDIFQVLRMGQRE